MLRLILRSVFVVFVLVGACVGAVRAGYSVVYPAALAEAGVFGASGCALPCWRGLQEFVTNEAEFSRVAADFQHMETERGISTFYVDDTLSGHATMRQGQMVGLILIYEACPKNLIRELGVPDMLLVEDSSLMFLYRESLELRISGRDGYRKTTITIWEPHVMTQFLSRHRGRTVPITDWRVEQILLDCGG